MLDIGKSERNDLVTTALGEARLGPRGWYRANCPFCELVTAKSDRRWSLGIEQKSGVYHCFRCGTAGRIPIDPESVAGMGVGEIEEAPEEPIVIEPPEGYTPLWREPGLTAMVFAGARRYMRDRGFGRTVWRDLNIGACADGWAGKRVIIPILPDERGGDWLGWIGRDWSGNASPKYLYPPGMPRGTILFQHQVLFEETDELALVVEGSFDAMPYLGRCVACLGKPSKWQVEAMKAAKRPVVIALDGDAHEEAYALSMLLKLEGVRAGYVHLPPKEDPASMAKKEGPEWLLERARAALE